MCLRNKCVRFIYSVVMGKFIVVSLPPTWRIFLTSSLKESDIESYFEEYVLSKSKSWLKYL